VWATWLWPIAAFILAAGWSRVGKSAFEASILETRPLVAAFKTVIPAMRVFVVSGVVVTFSLFLGEYTVPHANGVSVVSTEALVLADSGDVLGILGVSLPVTLVAAICAIAVWRKRGKVSWVGADGRMRVGRQGATPWHGWGILALTVGAPLIPLFWRWTLFSEMVEAFRVYGVELATSAALCLGAGAVAVCIGIFVASLGRWASVAVIVVIMFGLVPGAVTGVGVLTAYRPTGWVAGVPALPSVMGWIYDSWGIVVLGLGGRYAWVALVCSFAAIRADGPTLDEQASVDGSGASARLGMKLRGHWRVLAAGLWISTALSFSDVAVGSIVETPSTPMVGKILIEKYHRFETGMLVSLSLLCVLMTIPGALLIAWLMRRRVA
jgi:ABC-type spermidine/putrescine transport system permease subunit II